MSSLPMRFVLLIAVLFCSLSVTAQENPKTKSGSIAGRVVLANKGVAGVTVTVTLRGDALSGSALKLSTSTDHEGRYRVSNLPPAMYFVWPFVPAFVVAEATGVHPFGKSVTVVSGETADEINFTLTRGAVITGKITDTTGRVVTDERVRILPVQTEQQRFVNAIYPSINDIRTDDRGIYRVYGLPAGAYRVAVGDPEFAALTSTTGRRFYPETFHPNVNDVAKAQIVELPDGAEATGVDITVVRPLAGFSASGRFVDAKSGQPVPDVSFGITTLSDKSVSRGYVSLRGESTSKGLFQIDNLPPGTYAISVLGGENYGASESFTIRDSDVSDIEVKTRRGSMITGNVIVEGATDRSITAKLSRAQLEAYTWSVGNSVGVLRYSDINPDGSFQIGPLRAGTLALKVRSRERNVTPDFALMAIEHNGVDKSTGFQISDGEDVSGVRLIVGYGTGTIRGTVRVEGGTIPVGTQIDAAFIRPGSPLTIAHTRVDARGQFVFERVPPGNYEVGVNAYLQTGRVSARQAVVTSNGVVTEITLTLNLTAPPKSVP
jgi:hypothetical protein